MNHKSFYYYILLLAVLVGCTPYEQKQLETLASEAGQTAIAEAEGVVNTQVSKYKETAGAQISTEVPSMFGTLAAEAKSGATTKVPSYFGTLVATQLEQNEPTPWDTDWLSSNQKNEADEINRILFGTGLQGKGDVIVEYSKKYQINPAFVLAMFRKEAIFARIDTRAYENNNPGNIIATGNCRGKPSGADCNGYYGEISTDGRFGVYATMNDGIIAYFMLLSNEYKPGTSRNCSDINCIITAYCPPSDCDTATYISQITEWTNQYQEKISSP